MNQRKLPVTILSGFLGAGKTSLLNHILPRLQNCRVAVLVNDMSEISIDSELIRVDHTATLNSDDQIVEMANGCICCTLRDDFIEEVAQLAESGRFDYLLIESTGISEPLPVAASFSLTLPGGNLLGELATIDTMVTVVDASRFELDFHSGDELRTREIGISSEDDRTMADLLVDQVETADLILLNKVDAVEVQQRERLHALLCQLNPGAKILETTYGQVDPSLLVGAERFDLKRTMNSKGWAAALLGESPPETEEYGISSFLFERETPLHPGRFLELLNREEWQNVLRCKGFLYLATRPEQAAVWSQAGNSGVLEPGQPWSDMDKSPAQRLVVIGQDLDHDMLRYQLDLCLAKPDELTDISRIQDPFPAWE